MAVLTTEVVELVRVVDIVIREDILPRDAIHIETVKAYARDWANLPPIALQAGTNVLVDGRHRLAAAKELKLDEIHADYVDVTDEALLEAAFEANREHGLPLKMSDKRRAAKAYLERHPDATDQDIAAWAGIDRSTVYRWRHPHEASDDDPESDDETEGTFTDSFSTRPLLRFNIPARTATEMAHEVDPANRKKQLDEARYAIAWLEDYCNALEALDAKETV